MSGHVVIVGGGVGALEGLLALQALVAEPARISVMTATRRLTYRALSVAEPFDAKLGPRYDWAEIARDRGVGWIPDVLVGVRPGAHEVDTRDGPPVGYDALLLALGARPIPALPGALTFSGPRDVAAFMEAIRGLAPGRRHRVAFVAASGTAWTLPLYELALLTASRAERDGVDLAIELVTTESAPLGVFGAEASEVVAHRLARAGIHVRTGSFAEEVEDGKIWLELEGPLEADLVVALPRLVGPAIPGLPCDDHGFVPVDQLGRVRETDWIWAVGDMTPRPLKQGGLAAQQADVAAADIAARFGAPVEARPYRPVLHGVLLTGREPEFLRRRPRSTNPSEAATDPLWWPAQKVVGRYLTPYLEALGPPPLPGRAA